MLVDLEQRNWVSFLNALARRLNPWLGRRWYWWVRTVDRSLAWGDNWAGPVAFTDGEAVTLVVGKRPG